MRILKSWKILLLAALVTIAVAQVAQAVPAAPLPPSGSLEDVA
jgi:hypothetical protein